MSFVKTKVCLPAPQCSLWSKLRSRRLYDLLRRRGFDAPADNESFDRESRQKGYGRRTRAVLELLTHFEKHYAEYNLSEALLEHDEFFPCGALITSRWWNEWWVPNAVPVARKELIFAHHARQEVLS